MKNLRNLVLGFLWGVGFSVASLLVFASYLIHVDPQIDRAYNEERQESVKKLIHREYGELSPEVVQLKIVGKKAEITLALKPNNGLHKVMSLALFDKDDEFITVCDERLPIVATTNEFHYFKVDCPITDTDLKPTTAQVTLRH